MIINRGGISISPRKPLKLTANCFTCNNNIKQVAKRAPVCRGRREFARLCYYYIAKISYAGYFAVLPSYNPQKVFPGNAFRLFVWIACCSPKRILPISRTLRRMRGMDFCRLKPLLMRPLKQGR